MPLFYFKIKIMLILIAYKQKIALLNFVAALSLIMNKVQITAKRELSNEKVT